MPSIKTSVYDGCVYLNPTVDSCNVSGDIDRTVNGAIPKGAVTLVGSASFASTILAVGDKLMYSDEDELIGEVESISTTTVTLKGPGSRLAVPHGGRLHIMPRFEIVRIDTMGTGTYISELWPVETKHPGSHLPSFNTWASNAAADFGAVSGDGTVFAPGSFPGGTTITGRFKRVEIDTVDPTDPALAESAIVYLKARPVTI